MIINKSKSLDSTPYYYDILCHPSGTETRRIFNFTAEVIAGMLNSIVFFRYCKDYKTADYLRSMIENSGNYYHRPELDIDILSRGHNDVPVTQIFLEKSGYHKEKNVVVIQKNGQIYAFGCIDNKKEETFFFEWTGDINTIQMDAQSWYQIQYHNISIPDFATKIITDHINKYKL